MDRLWTPWRYNYISGEKPQARKGVPEALEGWPGEDADCVFCNLIRSVEWGVGALGVEAAERAGHVLARLEHCFVCLNAFPYASGHLLIVPLLHTDSLAKLPWDSAGELVRVMQRCETALREVYKPDGINLGMNLGQAAGAGSGEPPAYARAAAVVWGYEFHLRAGAKRECCRKRWTARGSGCGRRLRGVKPPLN